MLIVQSQTLLDVDHPSTLVIPLTTNLVYNAEPLRIRVPAADQLSRDSDLLIDQLRAIDTRRLTKGPLTQIMESRMVFIDDAIREVLDLVVI